MLTTVLSERPYGIPLSKMSQEMLKISVFDTNIKITYVTSQPHLLETMSWSHDDVIKWKHFPRYWPFVWVRLILNTHRHGGV